MVEKKVEEKAEVKGKSMAVQVPALTMSAVKPIVQELHQTGLSLSRAVLADNLGTTLKSSNFMQKIAAARYYGFVMIKPDAKLAITPLGTRYAEGQISAAQEGFAKSAFGEIASGLIGLRTDLKTIVLHLVDAKAMPKSSAERLAPVLIRAAQEADLMDGDRLKSHRIEELMQTQGASPASPDASVVEPEIVTATRNASQASAAPRADLEEPLPVISQPQAEPKGPSVVLHINTAPLSYEESLALIRELANSPLESLAIQDDHSLVGKD